MQVVILGGGYAGLTVASEIKKRNPYSSVILIDKKPYFTKLTHLHKTVIHNPEKFRLSYTLLGKKLGFRFIQDNISFNSEVLSRFNRDRGLLTAEGVLTFDALVVATGAKPNSPVPADGITTWDLEQITEFSLAEKLRSLPQGSWITVCGAGATGLQFLCEIASAYMPKFKLRLINFAEIILDQWPIEFHRYVMDKLNHWNIEYYPATELKETHNQKIILRNRLKGDLWEQYSDLTLLFTGVVPHPYKIYADSRGKVLHEGEVLDAIFTAGDCSHFATGLNTMTAQAALRKARIVAHNINLHHEGKAQHYTFHELGYFISLGPGDAIGYLLHRNLHLKGMAAWLMKESIETQFDLYLNGINTFVL